MLGGCVGPVTQHCCRTVQGRHLQHCSIVGSKAISWSSSMASRVSLAELLTPAAPWAVLQCMLGLELVKEGKNYR
jgi:hypothetical protein